MAISWTIPKEWQEQPLRLSAWYADPQPQVLASENMQGVGVLLQHAYLKGADTSLLKIVDMTARYWLVLFTRVDFDNLLRTLDSKKYHALACLVYGQLLVSQKRGGAHEMLKQGFDRIEPWLQADEYFILLKRHQQLSILVPGLSASAALSLQELLNEAAVVRKLQGDARIMPKSSDRLDTLG